MVHLKCERRRKQVRPKMFNKANNDVKCVIVQVETTLWSCVTSVTKVFVQAVWNHPWASISKGLRLCKDCTESRQTKHIDTPVAQIVDNQTDRLQDKLDKLVTVPEVVDLTDTRTDITSRPLYITVLKRRHFCSRHITKRKYLGLTATVMPLTVTSSSTRFQENQFQT